MTRLLPILLALVFNLSLLSHMAWADFADVTPDSWHAQPIDEMHAAGWISGYPDGYFHPDDDISAAQFVAILARCKNLSPAPSQSTHWAADACQAALQAGWCDWDELPPTGEKFDQAIPRQVAAKILMRAFFPQAHGDYLTESAFSDLNGRYYDAVLAAYALGISAGDSVGYFHPQAGLSRAEACALTARALQKSTTASPVPKPLPTPPTTPSSGRIFFMKSATSPTARPLGSMTSNLMPKK